MKKKTKLVYGVGVNDADYEVNRKRTIGIICGVRKQEILWKCPFYARWVDMLKRAYSKKLKEIQQSYENVSVCKEWLTFSNFKSWMEKQDWEGKHLDKDILVVGNTIYSPDTCVFVDRVVNNFILDSLKIRGDLPIGVTTIKSDKNRYMARCRNPFTGKQEVLGYFSDPESAYKAWLIRKLELATQLAAEQTDKRVAKALIDRYSSIFQE